jgi:hypothetical protein
MAGAQSIETIIRQECLPQRDCMLTVTDDRGDAAFLYFKEAELIEANYAALWGKDALAEILTWNLVQHTVAPLPLGIKRSLWDKIEHLLDPSTAVTSGGKLAGAVAKAVPRKPAGRLEQLKSIAGLLKLLQIEKGKQTVIQDRVPENGESENSEWLTDFAERLKSVGDTLGFGSCEKWTVETERYQIVAVRLENGGYGVALRNRDLSADDLEAAVAAALEAA